MFMVLLFQFLYSFCPYFHYKLLDTETNFIHFFFYITIMALELHSVLKNNQASNCITHLCNGTGKSKLY